MSPMQKGFTMFMFTIFATVLIIVNQVKIIEKYIEKNIFLINFLILLYQDNFYESQLFKYIKS